jgi:superfamily I DNA/RNA helicase
MWMKQLTERRIQLNFNDKQQEIVNHIYGPLLCIAGPGSGKTHVLTLRCARLIYKEHILPEHILVLAYNRAVVVELRNRLNKLFTSL